MLRGVLKGCVEGCTKRVYIWGVSIEGTILIEGCVLIGLDVLVEGSIY